MTIEHPSMRKAKGVATKTANHYVVDDESQPQPSPEPTYSPIPDSMFNTTISSGPKTEHVEVPQETQVPQKQASMLEDLLFLGRATKDVVIGKFTFGLQTLNHEENVEMAKALFRIGDGADYFTVRSYTLAHAVKTVNGQPLESLSDQDPSIPPVERRLAVLQKMQRSVTDKLNEAFDALVEDSDKSVEVDAVKNS